MPTRGGAGLLVIAFAVLGFPGIAGADTLAVDGENFRPGNHAVARCGPGSALPSSQSIVGTFSIADDGNSPDFRDTSGVTFSTSPLPAGVSVSFNPSTLAAGPTAGGTVTAEMVTTVAGTTSPDTPLITVTATEVVSEQGESAAVASASFNLIVPTCTAPTISNVANRVTTEDTTTDPIAVTVGDDDTPAEYLSLSATSDNQAVVANSGIAVGGSGANRTVTITPVADAGGSATITLTVTDGWGATVTDTFVLEVGSVNDAPTISAVPNQTMTEDTPRTIEVTVGDVDGPLEQLVLSASSDNSFVVANEGVTFGGANDGTPATRTVTITPKPDAGGPANITLTVTEFPPAGVAATRGLSASRTFEASVGSVNDAPTISDVADQSTPRNTTTGAITVTVRDVDDAAESLVLTGSSGNPAVVANSGITVGGFAGNRTVTITPVVGATGTATITLTVTGRDGLFATDSFVLTVTAEPPPPPAGGGPPRRGRPPR